MVLWLVSVQIFGAIVYVQKGATSTSQSIEGIAEAADAAATARTLFIAGALHLCVRSFSTSLRITELVT